MPIRCTAQDIKSIAETDLESFPDTPEDLIPFIRPASRLVDLLCAPAKRPDGTLWHDDDSLKDVEIWLSAHFYKILDPQLVREEVSTLRAVYQQEVKVGLDQTRYGQMAKLIDVSGALASYDNQQKKGGPYATKIQWLGTEDD